ncbi:MAG: hypothetical protein HY547_09840 [Elusimicrobia bacterium]|nr:hypothetical protein [Elusimicrobiota bacterium]
MSCDLVIKPEEAVLDEMSRAALSDFMTAKKVEFLNEHAKTGEGSKSRKIRLRFLTSPVEVIGADGRVKALKIERNALAPDGKGGLRAQGTGQFEFLPVGLVFRSVGYHGVAIPGVPFDEKSGHIPNDRGRVLEAPGHAIKPGEYVVGWAKRGPSGLIGTNRADSEATVEAMFEDVKLELFGWSKISNGTEGMTPFLAKKGVKIVTFSQWKELDRLEIERGARAGKIREKFTAVEEMLRALSMQA